MSHVFEEEKHKQTPPKPKTPHQTQSPPFALAEAVHAAEGSFLFTPNKGKLPFI